MKTLNINFDDEDFELLNEAKGNEQTWKEFMLTLVQPKTKKMR